MAYYHNSKTGKGYSDADLDRLRRQMEKDYEETNRRILDPSKFRLDTKLGQARYALDCWFYKKQAEIIINNTIDMIAFFTEDEISRQIDIRLNMLVKLYNQKAEAMGIYPYNENKLTTIVS